MALKLTLKPGERVAVNGAVIVNGARRSAFLIENHANVLRARDIMQAHEADTPAKRVYLPIMLMALDAAAAKGALAEYEARLVEFMNAVGDAAALQTCAKLAANVANGEFYKALSQCRTLIDFERTRLAHVA